MLYEKDGEVVSLQALKWRHPNTSFGPNTPYELGWADHVLPTEVRPTTDGVPPVVSRFQARAALHLAGLLAAAEAAVAQADAITQLAWKDAIEFRRDSPALNGLAAGLGLTSEQLDELFVTASRIHA